MSILLGAVADDFTGASDLANTLARTGMRVRQFIGPPGDVAEFGEAEAAVVALKSRTAPVEEAVEQSLGALASLREAGAAQIIFKYCSTFDSTADGNIGPVGDALMAALGASFAFVCPAFPENGRTIYQGHLFVGDRLLAESPMKDHPLTPMRDSDLVRLMRQQSRAPVGLAPLSVVRAGEERLRAHIAELQSAGMRWAVADAVETSDLEVIGRVAADHRLVTGGSAVAVALPDNFRRRALLAAPTTPASIKKRGRQLVLAGSCSQATRAQLAATRSLWPQIKIDIDAVAAGEDVATAVIAQAKTTPADHPVTIFGSADPEEVKTNQAKYGALEAGEMIEATLGRIANGLLAEDFRSIIVAGGETSGAVVSALGVKSLRIGPEIAPGVPWTETLDAPGVSLALKSGNFGEADFFSKAFGALV